MTTETSIIRQIAYSATRGQLCFFIGTGFSKAVSKHALDWESLLGEVRLRLESEENLSTITERPREEGLKNPSLEDEAQILEEKLRDENKNIYEIIGLILSEFEVKEDIHSISSFMSGKNKFKVITTNYDNLIKKIAGEDCSIITRGEPIHISNSRVEIYHIHGSIEAPENMVVTSEDYSKFSKEDSYFPQKINTLLHENTLVILGYSLSDTHIKAILNDYKVDSRNHGSGASIFLVCRHEVSVTVKSLYHRLYGIVVLDSIELEKFFHELDKEIINFEKHSPKILKAFEKIARGEAKLNKEYFKNEKSFDMLYNTLEASGKNMPSDDVFAIIVTALKMKIELTTEPSAWDQYADLADWLVFLGATSRIKGTELEDQYKEATLYSMNHMSPASFGTAWRSYDIWDSNWETLLRSNRELIKEHVYEKSCRQEYAHKFISAKYS